MPYKKRSSKSYIEKAQKKFPGRFDYSRVPEMIFLGEKLDIHCILHGDLNLCMTNHLQDKTGGCAKCRYDLNLDRKIRRSLKRLRRSSLT